MQPWWFVGYGQGAVLKVTLAFCRLGLWQIANTSEQKNKSKKKKQEGIWLWRKPRFTPLIRQSLLLSNLPKSTWIKQPSRIAHTGSGVSGCGCDGARMAEEVSARQRHSQQVGQSSSSTAGPELNLQQAASFWGNFLQDTHSVFSSRDHCYCLLLLLASLIKCHFVSERIQWHSHWPPWPSAVVVVPDARPQNQ